MEPVSLKVLARELNLSVSTVSRALNDSSDISQHTKDRARALATKLKYEPNPYASSLRSQKSKTIGVIIPEVDNHFFSLAINGIEKIARENNYHVLISLTHEEHQQEIAIIQMLAGGRVDGILLSTTNITNNYKYLDALKERNIPLVFFDRVNEGVATAKVTTNDYASGYQATQHLVQAGCRTIVHLTISDQLSISQGRWRGYADALRDNNLAYDEKLVLQGTLDELCNISLIQNILQTKQDIDGIFASVEMLAMNSYQACHNLGRSIPEDIKIIGFSNLELAALLSPPLTTITQPAYAIGEEAARLLFRAVHNDVTLSTADNLELQSKLIVRKSTQTC